MENFIHEFKERYPTTEIYEGHPFAFDFYAKRYQSIVIGGEKSEGNTYPYWLTFSAQKCEEDFKHHLWKYWWQSLDKFVHGGGQTAKVVFVRSGPRIVPEGTLTANAPILIFPCKFPEETTTIFGRTYQISARLSFHYTDPRI